MHGLHLASVAAGVADAAERASRRTLPGMDDIDGEPACGVCGTVMYVIDGGYRCRACGFEISIPWVEHPGDGDVLDGRWG